MILYINSNKKTMDLIQNWGVRFEDDQQNPIFSKLYNGLKARMPDFGDENEVRRKLGKPPISSPQIRSQATEQVSQQSHNQQREKAPGQIKQSKKSNKSKNTQNQRKKIRLSDGHKILKSEIDNIVENINLTNSMIDNADPECLDLVVELVNTIKQSEEKLVETISSVDQADLVDYAIKVNDDCQTTINRYKQLKRGNKPSDFVPAHKNNNFDNPHEEEVKLDVSDDESIRSMKPSK